MSLCRLSQKEIPWNPNNDSRYVKSKRLTLDLIFSMLSGAGDVFRWSSKFTTVIKTHLCLSLVKNCLSDKPKIFGLSLSIFLTLVMQFRSNLKNEMAIFIDSIFLKLLESSNSTYLHKQRVVTVFYKLFADASAVIELFLNYDCQVYEKNVF